MRKTYRRKRPPQALSAAILRLGAVILAALAVKTAVPSDSAVFAASPGIKKLITGADILRAEFYTLPPREELGAHILLAELPFGMPEKAPDTPPEDAEPPTQEQPDENTDTSEENTDTDTDTIPETPEPSEDTEPPTETTITGSTGGYLYTDCEGIYLKNETDYVIDVAEYLAAPLTIPTDGSGTVLIIHTHGSEAFTPEGEDVYTPTDPYRTTDDGYNTIRVGDELERILTERGIKVIHDREYYDHPHYNGAYTRSYEAITAHLQNDPSIVSVIDLHRDALEGSDGTVYKTVADIGDEPCAQVMIISGTNFTGLRHNNWQENLKFALRLQAQMVNDYPSLARPLKISRYRYNQQATPASLIIEVGCSGNTLSEALNAVTYFGDCLADVLGAAE